MATYLSEILCSKIEKAIKESNAQFWHFMAQDSINTLLETEIRYNALYDLICEKEQEYKKFMNITNPSESVDLNDYATTIMRFSVATQCKLLMEDENITKGQLENVEKIFCKIFNVHYYEETGQYLC